MRDVDHDAQRVGTGHGLAAEIAHAGVAFASPLRLAALDVRRGAGAQVIVAGVDQAQVARAARVGGVDAGQVVAERIAVLDADHGREQAGGMVVAHLLRRGRGPDPVRILLEHHLDRRILALGLGNCIRIPFRRQRPLPHVDHEERGIQSAALHLAQVDLQRRFGANVETRLAHVVQRDVDVCVESEDVGFSGRRRRGLGTGFWLGSFGCAGGQEEGCRQRGGKRGRAQVHGVSQSVAGCSPAIISLNVCRRRTTA